MARRDEIAHRLARGESVVAAVLAEEFSVSEDAIRRDLRSLAAAGRCRRVYGGALPLSPASGPVDTRVAQKQGAKQSLARQAATLVQPDEVIFLDSGSTNLALAHELPEHHDLTVVTNSVDIAAAVMRRRGVSLIVIGGVVDATVGGCVDGAAVLEIQRISIDRCFLGACSVSVAQGVSAFHPADATFKRTVLSVSRESAVMVTTEKLETRARYEVASLARIEVLVLEHDSPQAARAALGQAGPKIVVAEALR